MSSRQLASRLGAASVGILMALLLAPALPGRLSTVAVLVAPVAAMLIPDLVAARARKARHRELVVALPDALDLLAVGVAAGRSPVAGFAEIAAGDGPLAQELRMVVAEVSCGRPVSAALDGLRARVPGPEVASLCAAIERSRRFGSPLADQLRRQSTSLRRDRRRSIEEHAARAAPKIQLVVALVLVPSVLLMIVAGLIANADVLLGGLASTPP